MKSITIYLSEGKVKEHFKRNTGHYLLGAAALTGLSKPLYNYFDSNNKFKHDETKNLVKDTLKKDTQSIIDYYQQGLQGQISQQQRDILNSSKFSVDSSPSGKKIGTTYTSDEADKRVNALNNYFKNK